MRKLFPGLWANCLETRVKSAAQFLFVDSMTEMKKFFRCLSSAGKSFMDDNGLKLSASLSYYTVFALGPILLLIISFAGIFYGKD
ncbi:MAG TPA: hypothetical protein PKJ36_00450, partial [Flavihumibacter sp.]|nr:hypothetical protein [Flavihumibacter sp.]